MKAILRPFHKDPFMLWTKVSPLMTRDKPSGVGKRVIIDLSFPQGQSVNDGVQRHAFQGRPFTYTLPTPLDLAEAIIRAGRGAFLGKADMERAYRQMCIDPLGFWVLMFDTRHLSITIPEARLKDVLDEAGRWVLKTSAPCQEVQSLAGNLNFSVTCVRPARKFMGRILAALQAADEDGLVSVSPAFKKDLSWFINFARGCNRSVMLEPPLKQVVIESDACLEGVGGELLNPVLSTGVSPGLCEGLSHLTA